MRIELLSTVGLCLLASELARGAEWFVAPGESIQAVVAAANDGDLIRVAPGTYHQTVDFAGKALRIVSIGGPEVTILDGTSIDLPIFRAVFAADEIAKPQEIDGFTLRRGTGAGAVSSIGAGNGGGGVHAIRAELIVRRCVFTENRAALSPTPSPFDSGSGILGVDADIVLEDSVFLANQTSGLGGAAAFYGGMIAVRRCSFIDHSANWAAGALYARTAGSIEECSFFDNSAATYGGAIWATNEGGPLTITRCEFRANSAEFGAGGLYVRHTGIVTIAGCRFLGNRSNHTGTALILDLFDPGSTIRSCAFSGNVASRGLGDSHSLIALQNHFPSEILFDHITVANQPTTPWIHVPSTTNVITCTNSIFWNSPPLVTGIPANVSLCNSIVEGGGTSACGPIFSADPQFVDPAADDLHLLATSPARGRGVAVPGLPPLHVDMEGDVVSLVGSDLGADQYAARTWWNGAEASGAVGSLRILDEPAATPIVLFAATSKAGSPTTFPFGAFELATPVFAHLLPPMPSAGVMSISATLPPVLGASGLWFQAYTGTRLTAAMRLRAP